MSLTWTDPPDEVTTPGGLVPAIWKFTKIIRKAGSAPQNPYDGVPVVQSGVRNQYSSTPYVDTGLINDTTYYYAAYAYTTQFAVSEGAVVSATPKTYRPVLADNSWAEIDDACSNGLAASLWQVGDEKDMSFQGETLTVVIMDFDHDDLTEGGKACITFGMKNLMAGTREYNRNYKSSYVGTGFASYCESLITNNDAPELIAAVRQVNKTCATETILTSFTAKGWGFSVWEIFGSAVNYEGAIAQDGTIYSYFATAANRKKNLANGSGDSSDWWTRSFRSGGGTICYIGTSGNLSTFGEYSNKGICMGFCIGKEAS